MTRSSQCHRTARDNTAPRVGAKAGQILDGVTMVDPDDVLLDNRPLVEIFGHVVSGGADEFDPALLGPPVRRCANKRRQERVVDVDHRAAEFVEEMSG